MLASDRTLRQRGFVLAVTLWILAGIAVVVGLVTLWALDAVRKAASEREQTEDLLAIHGTRDTLLYLGATREQTLAGLPVEPMSDEEVSRRTLTDLGGFIVTPRGGELRLDGRSYLGLAGTRFAIQDEAGLYALVVPSPARLDHFLDVQGVDANDIPRLRDALLDYFDTDPLRRLNGAEAREYERAGRRPPPGRRLLLPVEAGAILGWEQLPQALRDRLPELTTTFESGAVNLNTAPEALLPTWIAGCPETCKALVARRDARPFGNSRELEQVLGVRLPGDSLVDYRYLGSDVLRLTLWGRSGAARRIHVRFTPVADQRGPWSILAAYPVPRPADHATTQATGSDLFADPPPGGR
ncbi:MAG: general secretion pathway protein GspK [Pseudomonadota bacterium]|nr:general secretion pathway protein GspK [Pseudomonadota bacterium]